MKSYFIVVIISLSIACSSQGVDLVNTKWCYDNGYCQDYFEFNGDNQYVFYSCETGDTLIGSYQLRGDKLILKQVHGSNDYEFLNGSRHKTPSVKFEIRVKGNSMSFVERWDVDAHGNWLKSDYEFPKDYTFIKQVVSEELISNWKMDSLGCNNLRTLDYAKKLIQENDLLGKSKKKFIQSFGNPNEIVRNNERFIFIYYIETRCNEGVIESGADKCWIQFNFVENKLLDIPEVFACE